MRSGTSANPHILPRFVLYMRIRGQAGRIGMIGGVRLGHFFSSLSCLITDRACSWTFEEGLKSPAIDVLT